MQRTLPSRRLLIGLGVITVAVVSLLVLMPLEAHAYDNPIEVPDHLLAQANSSPDKCKYVDLSSIKPPPNPGFVGEDVNGVSVSGQTMWEVSFYLMLYTNCERQKRGLAPFRMYTGDQMVAMQATMFGNPPGHHGFGERSDIVGGGTAEQAFGTRRVEMTNSNEGYLDDDGDGIWDPHETARRVVSGANYFDGLVNHGGATFSPDRKCIFGGASLGPEASAWMPVILFYGSKCDALGTFNDDDASQFEGAIEWLVEEGITSGCNPPWNDKFCPDRLVTRGELAVFLARALEYTDDGGGDLFKDDDGLFYENAADKLKTAKVSRGCNPPKNDLYCGDRKVTRGEFAALMGRALGLTDNGGGDLFVDDNGHLFEDAIDRLAAAKITSGCNPPTNNRFCPDQYLTRGQIAAFFKRALS